MLFKLVKHFLDRKTRSKLHVLGSMSIPQGNVLKKLRSLPPLSGNWQEVLLEHISPDQLPQAYGGTRCEPDPYCTDYVSGTSLYTVKRI